MAKTDDIIYLLCGLLDQVQPVTEGIKAYCAICNQPVWLSDSTIQTMKLDPRYDANIKPIVVCIMHGFEMLHSEHEEVEIMPISDFQWEDIKKHIK